MAVSAPPLQTAESPVSPAHELSAPPQVLFIANVPSYESATGPCLACLASSAHHVSTCIMPGMLCLYVALPTMLHCTTSHLSAPVPASRPLKLQQLYSLALLMSFFRGI